MRIHLLALFLLLSACNDGEGYRDAPAAIPAATPADKLALSAPATETAPDSATPAPLRYLAERQHWVIELAEDKIEARWQTHLELCRTGCEVLQANIAKSSQTPVNASLQLRVARAQASTLFKAMSGPEVKERRVEREDKTLQVVDTEARLKNLKELRDRLRRLLDSRPGNLKDVLETERELARVQGELDAQAAQRKALSNETEKILLTVEYRPEPSLTRTGALHPVADVFSNASYVFAESLAAALDFLIRALPWLFLVLPAVWGGWKLVKRLFVWRRNANRND